MRTFAVAADLGGPPGDKGIGHALREQPRRLRLKIDQLIDRGVGGDLALQRLEPGMVHGGVALPRQIGERNRDLNGRTLGKP
jgi:hypothetical protein